MAKAEKIVRFFFNDVKFTLRDRKKLKQFVISIFELERRKIDFILYVFSTDQHLKALNKKYLSHDYKTDILTFPISYTPLIQAEIYISTEMVKKNSNIYRTPFKEELLRVIFHGVMHLCGYKDSKQKEKRQMRKREDYYLKLYQKFHVKPSR